MTAAKVEKAAQLLDDIESLCCELRELLVGTDNGARIDEAGANLLPNGGLLRVIITNGGHRGATGRVTGRRGTQFWWIKLDNNGQMVYKMPHNVRIVSDSGM